MIQFDKQLLADWWVTFTFKAFHQEEKVLVRVRAYTCHHAVALAMLVGNPAGKVPTDCILVDAETERIVE